MAYVTDDKRVKPIVEKLRRGSITELEARKALWALPPEPGCDFGLLDWEVDEAIRAAKKRRERRGRAVS